MQTDVYTKIINEKMDTVSIFFSFFLLVTQYYLDS